MINVPESSIYEFDAFCVDSGKRLLLRDDEIIALTPKVFETLLYLVNHNGKVLEKDELMSAIWPDTIVEENNLNKNISVLRQVLGENPGAHRFIVTVPGKGYKFVADVRTISVEKIPETSDSKPRRERRSSKRSAFAAAGVIAAIRNRRSCIRLLVFQQPTSDRFDCRDAFRQRKRQSRTRISF